jgi:hypothetical protein
MRRQRTQGLPNDGVAELFPRARKVLSSITSCCRLPGRVALQQVRDGRRLLVDHLVPTVCDDLHRYVSPAVIPERSSNLLVERRHRVLASCQHNRHIDRVSAGRIETLIEWIRPVDLETSSKLVGRGVRVHVMRYTAVPMLPRIAMPSAPPSSELVSDTAAAAPPRSGGAVPTVMSVASVNTGARPSENKADPVTSMASPPPWMWPSARKPAAARATPVTPPAEGGSGRTSA